MSAASGAPGEAVAPLASRRAEGTSPPIRRLRAGHLWVYSNEIDVAAMLRLKECGWGLKRIARELGCSHHTVKHYVAAGGPRPSGPPHIVR